MRLHQENQTPKLKTRERKGEKIRRGGSKIGVKQSISDPRNERNYTY